MANFNIDYLVVAGGGGASGGTYNGQGGGAGGFLTNYGGSALSLETGTNYSVSIGGGGASTNNGAGVSGSDSVFASITSDGGGGGGTGSASTGGAGGSGGAGSTAGGTATSGQGNNGGVGDGPNGWVAGGGGGASAAGGNISGSGTTWVAGNGGNGLSSSITGTATTYAGGGAGGGYNYSGYSFTPGTGGTGGGGNGSNSTNGSNGTDFLGGGGGGGNSRTTSTGGSGGSGIVVLRYATADVDSYTVSGAAPTETTDGTDTILSFTTVGTGSITFTSPAIPITPFDGTRATTPVTGFNKTGTGEGLKLPSGDNSNQPVGAFVEQGMIRNDTEETVDSSASALTHYNGTAWQYFAATESADNPLIPSQNFNTVLYTGNETSQSITGTGFQPDLIWVKNRDTTNNHLIFDSIRGNNFLIPNDTFAENTSPSNTISSFDSDGFSISGGGGSLNNSSDDYVAWCFKAGGAAVSNTDGSITSQVSANAANGFSIVKWSATTTGADTLGHGLDSKPELVIMKKRSGTSNWFVYTDLIDGSLDYLFLNTTAAKANSTLSVPTSSLFTQGNLGGMSANDTCIAYCFHSVPGYSKVGSYVGNGSTTGPIIDLGFEPAFLMYKCSSQVGNWIIVDNKRATSNPRTPHLRANTNSADDSGSNEYVDFTSNGFQPKGVSNYNNNSNNQTYIYMAFATS